MVLYKKSMMSWGSLLVCGLLLSSLAMLPSAYAEGEDDELAGFEELEQMEEQVEQPAPKEPKPAGGVTNKEAVAKKGEELEEAINDAAENQNYLQEADEAVVSKEVEVAPAAELANSDGDIATTGACKMDIIEFCPEVHPGASKLADCLTTQQVEEDSEKYSGKKLSEKCRTELDAFKIDRSTNINKNVPLAKACKKDTEKLCQDVNSDTPGAVIACLREKKSQVSDKCASELLEEMQEGANDFRKDAQLYDACKEDSEVVCPGVDTKNGGMQECLRKHRNQISWECQDELFRQDQENADDLRLSVRLFRQCLPDKKKFCGDVAPGNARAKECLEDHRLDEGFSEDCRNELDKMIELRVGDFRLDVAMREYCSDDIEYLCAFQKESLEAGTELDARVVLCLQDYRDEIQNPSCQQRVHKYIELASQDARFNVPLAEACYDDRRTYCAQVPPGSARVIRCLQDRREKLSFDCKAALFDQEVLMSENIDFNYPMKAACVDEIATFCKDVPHGHSRVIRCLADNKDKDTFGNKCKAEVEKFEERSATDFRLNWALERACEDTVPQLCGDICEPMQVDPCGGKVLRCLVEKYENITNQECRSETFYFIRMEVNDFRNDVILAETCRPDVDKFCSQTPAGEGRVHSCLQDHRDELQPECKAEEIKLMVRQAGNVELVPSISKYCHEEMNVFCKGVKPGKARMFHCLMVNAQQADFSNQCRGVLTKQMHKRTRDWRLDYGLRSHCGKDVTNLCGAEAANADRGTGVVIKCLIKKVPELSESCAKEMSRVVSTALQFYHPENPVTEQCDADIASLCLKDKAAEAVPLGSVRQCLTSSVFLSGGSDSSVADGGEDTADAVAAPAKEEEAPPQEEEAPAEEEQAEEAGGDEQQEGGGARKLLQWLATEGRRALQAVGNKVGDVKALPRSATLHDECANVVLIGVMGERAYGSYEAILSSTYLVGQLKALGGGESTGGDSESSGGFVLQGWWALLGMLALAAIIMAGGYLAYRKYYGQEREYTAVVKNASV